MPAMLARPKHLAVLLLACCAAGVGCASQATAVAPQRLNAALPLTAQDRALATQPLPARAAAMDVPARTVSLPLDPDLDATQIAERVREARPGDDGWIRWTVTRRVLAGTPPTEDPTGGSVLHLALTDTGDVVLEKQIEAADGVTTTFTPPMIILPASLAPGQTFEQAFAMRSVLTDRPDRERGSGPATQTTTLAAWERIATPAGEHLAARIEAVLRAKLGPASVTSTSTTWYAPGLGILAETRREEVTVMGLKIRDQRQGWVLQSPGAP
jgi:hypothetical protein